MAARIGGETGTLKKAPVHRHHHCLHYLQPRQGRRTIKVLLMIAEAQRQAAASRKHQRKEEEASRKRRRQQWNRLQCGSCSIKD